MKRDLIHLQKADQLVFIQASQRGGFLDIFVDQAIHKSGKIESAFLERLTEGNLLAQRINQIDLPARQIKAGQSRVILPLGRFYGVKCGRAMANNANYAPTGRRAATDRFDYLELLCNQVDHLTIRSEQEICVDVESFILLDTADELVQRLAFARYVWLAA